jgi:two-component system, NtrC family, sensor kinase
VISGIATLDRLNAGVFSVDSEMRILHWNLFMASNSGKSADEVIGRDLFECFPELPSQWLRWKLRSVFLLGNYAFSSWKQRPYVFKFPHNRPLTGGIDFMRQDIAFLPIASETGGIAAVCAMLTDATDAALSHHALDQANLALKREMAERERVTDELRMAQKLEAVGQLAAGMAHEINTPIQYVTDSVAFIGEAFAELRSITQTYRQALYDGTQAAAFDDNRDLVYLEQNVPLAVERAMKGLDRIAMLVRAMQEFGQPASIDKACADLNRAINTTLTVTVSEYKDVADIELDLGPIPEVPCHVAELNQVFMHLIVNAAHAIAEAQVAPARGTIRIRTWCDGPWVCVSIADNGAGIPDEIRTRVFDPFFTTKPVGRGTGQGLTIARSTVDRHGGTLTFETAVGRGSTFIIRLPHSHAQPPRSP